MELITVTPDNVLTIPNQGVHIPELLQAYYSIVIGGGKLPPVVFAHKSRVTNIFLASYKKDTTRELNPRLEAYQFESYRERERLQSIDRLKVAKEFYRLMHDFPAQYLLFDGMHRSTALTLCNLPLNGYLINCAADVEKIRRMTACGELPGEFKHTTSSVTRIAVKFAHKCLSIPYGIADAATFNFESMSSRVERLIQEKEIPHYMIKRYLGKMKKG